MITNLKAVAKATVLKSPWLTDTLVSAKIQIGLLRPTFAPTVIATPAAQRRLFVDVTATARTNDLTGIQRVVRQISKALLESSQSTFDITLVELVRDGWGYRLKQAGKFSSGFA